MEELVLPNKIYKDKTLTYVLPMNKEYQHATPSTMLQYLNFLSGTLYFLQKK